MCCTATTILRTTFKNTRVLSRFLLYKWPLRSAYFPPCDFSLWSLLNTHLYVYRDRPMPLMLVKDAVHISFYKYSMNCTSVLCSLFYIVSSWFIYTISASLRSYHHWRPILPFNSAILYRSKLY